MIEKFYLKEVNEENLKETEKNFKIPFIYRGIADFIVPYAITDESLVNEFIEGQKKLWDESFDPKNMSNHKPFYKNTDLSEYIAKINHDMVESQILLILDEDDKVIADRVIATGGLTSVGLPETNREAVKWIAQFPDNKFMPKVIMIHNHPGSVAVYPSNSDYKCMYAFTIACKLMGAKFVDGIICGDYDIYSQYQEDEKNLHTNPEKVMLRQPSRNTRGYTDEELNKYAYKIKPLIDLISGYNIKKQD